MYNRYYISFLFSGRKGGREIELKIKKLKPNKIEKQTNECVNNRINEQGEINKISELDTLPHVRNNKEDSFIVPCGI